MFRLFSSLRFSVALICFVTISGSLSPPAVFAESMDDDIWSSWKTDESFDVLGAEERSAEDDRPRIPEPMVFDLVRPLGARRGEFEINTLGLIPLNRSVGGTLIPNPLGVVTRDKHAVEWAPEIEYAIADGVAVEFELPFEDSTLSAYKAAAQVTFGTAFEQQYIHGAQGILVYDRHSGNFSPTLLYLGGLRLNERFSVLGMLGVRHEINGADYAERTERLVNATLFYDVNKHMTVGVENDLSSSLSGNSNLLVMPQLHWEISDTCMLQSGVGVNMTKNYSLPLSAIRLIKSF